MWEHIILQFPPANTTESLSEGMAVKTNWWIVGEALELLRFCPSVYRLLKRSVESFTKKSVCTESGGVALTLAQASDAKTAPAYRTKAITIPRKGMLNQYFSARKV